MPPAWPCARLLPRRARHLFSQLHLTMPRNAPWSLDVPWVLLPPSLVLQLLFHKSSNKPSFTKPELVSEACNPRTTAGYHEPRFPRLQNGRKSFQRLVFLVLARSLGHVLGRRFSNISVLRPLYPLKNDWGSQRDLGRLYPSILTVRNENANAFTTQGSPAGREGRHVRHAALSSTVPS